MIRIKSVKPRVFSNLLGVELGIDFEIESKQTGSLSPEALSLLCELIAYGRCTNRALDSVAPPPSHVRGVTLIPLPVTGAGYVPYLYEDGHAHPEKLLGPVELDKLTRAISALEAAGHLSRDRGQC